MEKIDCKEITCTKTIHNFYCDKCNKLLLMSKELDDGYYEEPDEISLRVFVFDRWYHLNKGCYCEECGEDIKSKIIDGLKTIGFKEE